MKIHGVILAAGRGSRMSGRTPKLLLPVPGPEGREPILKASVRGALASRLERIHLVLGPDPERHAKALGDLARDPRLAIVHNPLWPDGCGSSIRQGFQQAASAGAEAVCFLCADQPRVSPGLIDRVCDAVERSGAPLAFPVRAGGEKANPVIFRVDVREELENVTDGDSDATELLTARWEEAEKEPLTAEEEGDQRDVDDAADYAALIADIARSGVPPETSPAPRDWQPPPPTPLGGEMTSVPRSEPVARPDTEPASQPLPRG